MYLTLVPTKKVIRQNAHLPMSEISLIPVERDDIAILHRLACDTFLYAFANMNDPADMDHYMSTSMKVENFEAQWNHPNSAFFFACSDDSKIGYLKLNTEDAQTDQVLDQATEIERIYIHHEYQSKGIGAKMIQFAKATAFQAGSKWIWLGAWDQNPRAIAFYKKQGFVPFGTHDFTLGNDQQRDILLKCKLL